MIKKFIIGLLAVGSLGFSLLASDDGAFIGTWKMNEAKTKSTNVKAKDITLVITKEGDTVIQSLKGMIDGKPISEKWSVPSGGGTANYIEGAPPAGIVSVSKVLDDRTVETTTTMGEKQISKGRTEISADHKTMTDKESGINEKGEPYKYVAVLERK